MSLAVKSRLAVGAARIGAHRLREKAARSRPVNSGELPSSAEAITTGWLTDLLCGGHPGAEVVDVSVTPGSDGTSARRGLTVAYNAAGAAAGLPTALYTKSTPNLQTRPMCGLSGIAAAEARFYSALRPAPWTSKLPGGRHHRTVRHPPADPAPGGVSCIERMTRAAADLDSVRVVAST